MLKSMSEPKNTALGGVIVFRYSYVSPVTNHLPLFTTIPMITATVILSALVLFISLDSSEIQHPE